MIATAPGGRECSRYLHNNIYTNIFTTIHTIVLSVHITQYTEAGVS